MVGNTNDVKTTNLVSNLSISANTTNRTLMLALSTFHACESVAIPTVDTAVEGESKFELSSMPGFDLSETDATVYRACASN